MGGADFRYVADNQMSEAVPRHASALAAAPERMQPGTAYFGPEHPQPFQIAGHGMVIQIALNHTVQPLPGGGNRSMPSLH